MNTLNKFLLSTLILAGLSLQLAWAVAPAPVPRTGQTPTAPLNPAPNGADGALEKGVAWPSPRFTDNGDGTVSDTLTDLVWLKNATCTDTVGGVNKKAGALKWPQALTWSNALASGQCGLTDGSAAGDWRLPNLRELESLIDLSQSGPALPADHPFQQVKSSRYWSSSTVARTTRQAWRLSLSFGDPGRLGKASRLGVWPVRDASLQPPNGLHIGDTYQGGIVFYIDGSGQHGLIAAPKDQGDGIVWDGCKTDPLWHCILTGATATAVGTGQANTNKIVVALGADDYAASLTANLVLNGYSDWFLPSKDELNLMYWNIGPGAPAPLTNIGGFDYYEIYWSSSENDAGNAWAQYFINGGQHHIGKDLNFLVRPVRAF